MSNTNLYAWASIGENGKATGGKVGNQTGTEVKVGKYYEFGQDKCIRFKNVEIGKKCGKISKELAKNKAIGYNQLQRYTLYNLAKKCGWDFDKLKQALKTTKVNCDCSSFASTCVNLAFGKQVLSCCTTITLVNACLNSTHFKVISIKKMLEKTCKGDLVIKEGKHVIINV